jgi:NADPH-dependent 2,4-dienoyl-CoA reductase/sulfur reductase-like enzyme/rhodanese-related sulfurtransferase
MASKTILVVGGAVGGPTAAARARETDDGARIILLERSRDVSYAACGLAYHLSGEAPSLDSLNRERADFFWDVYRVEVRTGAAVSAIDAAARTVRLEGERLGYRELIYAAGAESLIPRIPGLRGGRNVFRFRTLDDLEAISRRLEGGARRVVILGGGFFGVEAADGFLRHRCEVTVLERGPQILPAFTAGLSRSAAGALETAGATVVTRAHVMQAERSGPDVRALRLASGRRVPADVVIVAAGVRPRTALLAAAGARLMADGSVSVDNRCATSLPHVFACGVCVSVPHAVSDQPVYLAQAAMADKTAQVAGACAAGGDARLAPVLGTAIVRAGDLTLARTGLTRAEAQAYAGRALESVRIHGPSCDPFLARSGPATVELLYHARSGRILGAETAARIGADKSVDVLAAAILGGLTVDRLASIDLAYAPPYSTARNLLNVAGTVAASARDGLAAALSAAEVAARRRTLTLVDVRAEVGRPARSIRGSLRIPLPTLRGRVSALRGKRVVFLCDTGRLAYLAARIARQHGLPEAAYLSGGLRSWVAEGRALAPGRA